MTILDIWIENLLKEQDKWFDKVMEIMIEQLHKENKMNSLEKFRKLILTHHIDINEDIEQISRELKALEIIKKKRVNVLELSVCDNYETYMSFFKQWNWKGEYDNFIITQEEYELLKEVLL